jgi:hypothetical protein
MLTEHGHDCSGTTAQRPTNAEIGTRYFDTTIGQLLTWDGTYWVCQGIVSEEVTFTETGGAATYTGSVNLPAGATLIDIIVNGVALWDNAGAVTMKVGDTDDDGFYTGINLKATDLLAGESISFSHQGGKGGVYFAGTNTHVAPRYSASARTISGIITTASTGGSAGRTRMTVLYTLPGKITAATKV